MNSRERVLAASSHKKPDRVPMFFRSTPEAYENLKNYLGVNNYEELSDYLGVDVHSYFVGISPPAGWEPKIRNGITYDEWNIGRKTVKYFLEVKGQRIEGSYSEIVEHPLANIRDFKELDDYPWPDPGAPGRTAAARNYVDRVRASSDKAIIAMAAPGGSTSIFEQAWYMRGMENFLIDLHANRPLAEALLEKILQILQELWKKLLQAIGDKIDIAATGDDLAHQEGMLISPQMYRQFIKPRHKRLFSIIKKNTQAKLYYHSCGSIRPIIPDLIEIGVDILDPVQPLAKDMNPGELKKQFGKVLCFHGGIDEQQVLPKGSIEDVENEVKRRIDQMGLGGGLILGPAHWIQVDTPPENIIAMYETARKYGSYS